MICPIYIFYSLHVCKITEMSALLLFFQIVLLLKEYMSSGDIAEATRCLQELDVPHFHHELVYEVSNYYYYYNFQLVMFNATTYPPTTTSNIVGNELSFFIRTFRKQRLLINPLVFKLVLSSQIILFYVRTGQI